MSSFPGINQKKGSLDASLISFPFNAHFLQKQIEKKHCFKHKPNLMTFVRETIQKQERGQKIS